LMFIIRLLVIVDKSFGILVVWAAISCFSSVTYEKKMSLQRRKSIRSKLTDYRIFEG
jgi:hypothetical protein